MSDELMHYGVQGMRWGVRRAGPGRYLTKKRQLAGDKRDLETLNKGKHLSVGLTKKRQAALDKRDKAALEKRIAKNDTKPKDALPSGTPKNKHRVITKQDVKSYLKVKLAKKSVKTVAGLAAVGVGAAYVASQLKNATFTVNGNTVSKKEFFNAVKQVM